MNDFYILFSFTKQGRVEIWKKKRTWYVVESSMLCESDSENHNYAFLFIA